MRFISYAQNFEDVMLWRALKHVENGFYIDVGANDPSADSVTKAFYERNWHGINIEPLPSHHADLVLERSRDLNLQCAAGSGNGEIEIWECDVRGWATASAEVVAQHTANGHTGAFHKVQILRLTDICDQHVSGEIHFLKIDVEGFEKSVIDGMDFSRFRPWIVVIEATRPNSSEEIHDEWEGDLLSSDYVMAYVDGINRFYVAKEHSELLNFLRYPPNVFDGFVRTEQLNSEMRAQQAESNARQAENKARQAENKARQAEIETRLAEALSQNHLTELQAVYATLSWRVTSPLRTIKPLLMGNFSTLDSSKAALKLKAMQAFEVVLNSILQFVFNHPALRKTLNLVLNHFPRLRSRLLCVARDTGMITPNLNAQQVFPLEFSAMTPRSRQIYQDLMAAIESRHRGVL